MCVLLLAFVLNLATAALLGVHSGMPAGAATAPDGGAMAPVREPAAGDAGNDGAQWPSVEAPQTPAAVDSSELNVAPSIARKLLLLSHPNHAPAVPWLSFGASADGVHLYISGGRYETAGSWASHDYGVTWSSMRPGGSVEACLLFVAPSGKNIAASCDLVTYLSFSYGNSWAPVQLNRDTAIAYQYTHNPVSAVVWFKSNPSAIDDSNYYLWKTGEFQTNSDSLYPAAPGYDPSRSPTCIAANGCYGPYSYYIDRANHYMRWVPGNIHGYVESGPFLTIWKWGRSVTAYLTVSYFSEPVCCSSNTYLVLNNATTKTSTNLLRISSYNFYRLIRYDASDDLRVIIIQYGQRNDDDPAVMRDGEGNARNVPNFVKVSRDYGATWSDTLSTPAKTTSVPYNYAFFVSASGALIAAARTDAYDSDAIRLSTDGGQSWTLSGSVVTRWRSLHGALVANTNWLFASSYDANYVSRDNGATWSLLSGPTISADAAGTWSGTWSGVGPSPSAGAACTSNASCASGACRSGACCSASAVRAGCTGCAPGSGSCLTYSPGDACASAFDCASNLCLAGCCCAASALQTVGCTACTCWANASTTAATAGTCAAPAPAPIPPSNTTLPLPCNGSLTLNATIAPSRVIAFPASANVTGASPPLMFLPAASPLNAFGVDIIVASAPACAAFASNAAATRCSAASTYALPEGTYYYLGAAASLGMAAAPACAA